MKIQSTVSYFMLVLLFTSTFFLNSYASPPGSGNAISPLRLTIAEQLKTKNKLQLELFVMSQCPYAVEAEQALIPILKEWSGRIDFKLRFVASMDNQKRVSSLHGPQEVEESKRQAVMAHYYPQQFLDYLLARSKNYGSKDWKAAARTANIPTEEVACLTASAEGDKLLLEAIRPALERNIHLSPSIFINGEQYATGKLDALCGNGITESGEGCDDGNTVSGDGCSSACSIEPGWGCSNGTPSVCIGCFSPFTLSAPNPSQTGTTGTWTAPSIGTWKVRITAKGAKGGNSPGALGGAGAVMIGDFIVSQGQVLEASAGATGISTPSSGGGIGGVGGGGGGGGSGVRMQSGAVLIIAGGGGGATNSSCFGNNAGGPATITAGSGNGGNGGNGGGGGGLNSAGANGVGLFGGTIGGGGSGFNALGGLASGPGTNGQIGGGGYGGGGACEYGGGGGGGYSGGNGSVYTPSCNFTQATGGGSINFGTNQNNSVSNNGGGQVIIECLGGYNFTALVTPTQPACTNPTQGSLSIDLTGDINGNTTGVEYAIAPGSSFSGSSPFSTITADPFNITSFGTTGTATYTVRVRLISNPSVFIDQTYTITAVPDADNDGRGDACDNCPSTANSNQADADNDGRGDVCDNCPSTANANQADSDNDGRGDVCDNCLAISNANQADADGDGRGDACDNCPSLPNVDQTNADGDAYGAACDCNDSNPAIYPGATEVCNSLDDNCNGLVDDGITCAPPCATLTSPSNGYAGYCPSTTVNLTWQAATGATSYDVYFGTSSTPPFLVNTTNTNYITTSLTAGTYYWQIRPKNAYGTATGCAVWSFAVQDNTLPSITCNVGTLIPAANTNCQYVVTNLTGFASASDNCGVPTITQSPAIGTILGLGQTTVTLTATDAANNTAACTMNLSVTDQTPPTITCPGNQTVVLNASCMAQVGDFIALASASDNCTNPPTVTQSPVAATVLNGAGATQTVTLTARDAANLTATCSFTVTAVDQTPPMITCPANITQPSVPGQCGANVTFANATGTDNCGTPTITQIAGPASGSFFSFGTTQVSFRATDGSNNQTTCSFNVNITGQPEVCDGIDNDCNGVVDDGIAPTVCIPVGTPPGLVYNDVFPASQCQKGQTACFNGITVCQGFVGPSAEACDATDNDCDAQVDEGFTNTDGDSMADCVDPDDDNDGVVDGNDNCPLNANSNQADADTDGIGDACDPCTLPYITLPANGTATVACPSMVSQPTPPVGTNQFGTPVTPTGPTIVRTPDPVTCEGTVSYTWNYADCNGVDHPWSYTYTVERNDFAVPANGAATVACASDITTPTPPNVQSNCGETITPTGPTISATPACNGTKTYTWTYTDCEGNTHDWSFIYTIARNDFAVPANGAATVACASAAVQPTPPTVQSNCGETITPTGPVVSPTPACEGTKTYTWTYIDCANHSHTWSYVYTITRLDFTVPANGAATVACASDITTPTPPVVTSNCGETITPTGPTITPTPACEGTKTYTWTYTDCANHSHTWSYVYTITRLDFTVPANGAATVSCASAATQPTPPVVTSNCGETITPTGPVVSPTPACEGTKTYTWTYTDCAGHSHTWSYVYTITRMDFTVPANGAATVSCASAATQPTPPVVTSNCGETITPTGPTISATPACEGTKTYTWTYTDCAGHSHTWSYVYTITRLDFTVPANGAATVACPALAVQPTPPTVQSNCGETITPTGPVVSPTPACEGTKTYTWTYTDCAGHSHTWSYVYTITRLDFTVPANGAATVSCASAATQPTPPVVTSNCGETITPTGPVVSPTPACEGTKTYTWTYTDCANHSHTWSYVYTITRLDFTVPANGAATVSCASAATQPTPPVVTSNCGETITPTGPVISATPACEGTKTYTWTYTDCANHSHTWSYVYTITRLDFTVPANGAATVSCPALAVQPTPPTVQSNCGETITPTGPVISATPACNGTKTYTWTYADCAGHSHTWSFVYTITRLDFAVPANGAATVTCPALAVQPTPPTVQSNCGETITPTGPVISATPACEGTKTYTWTYADCAGHSHTWSYVYTIVRNDFAVPANGAATVSCPALAVQPTPPVVTSNCGETITPTGPVISATPACNGTKTYTWTYTDCAGHSHAWTFTYTIVRSDFSVPANGAATVACPALATQPTPPTVTSNCGETITPTGPVISSTPACEGTKTYTWTYTDCAGHSHTWAFTYTIERNPFSVPANGGATVACPEQTDVQPTPPIVMSNCGEVLTPVISSTAKPGCEGNRYWNFTYTDCEGNTATWIFTYTVEYLDFAIPPSESHNVECPLSTVQPVPPVVHDNCGKLLNPTGPTITDVNGTNGCASSRIYAWKYTDCEGNTHVWSVTYHFQYTADFFTYPDQVDYVGCLDYAQPPVPPTIYDNCGQQIKVTGPVVTEEISKGGCSGVRTYTYTYADCGGHSHTWSLTYIAKDNEPPVGKCPDASDATSVDVTNLNCIEELPCPDDFDFAPKVQQLISAGGFYDICSGDDLVVELDSWSDIWECSDDDNDGIFTFGRRFYFSIADQCGNQYPDLCSVTYSGVCQPIETFNQADWGNEGGEPGLSSANNASDLQVITELLNQGPLTIGGSHRSLTLTNAQCVLSLVPGIGAPNTLSNCQQVNCTGCNPAGPLGMKNSLATNTIALTLNMRYNILHNGLTLAGLRNQSLGCINISKDIVYCNEGSGCKLRVFESNGTVHEFPYTLGGLLDLTNLFLDGSLALTDGWSSVYATALNASIQNVNNYWRGDAAQTGCDANAGAGDVGERAGMLLPTQPHGAENGNFTLVPNPASREVSLQFEGMAEERTLELDCYNLMGQSVLHRSFENKGSVNERLDVSDLKSGLYSVVLRIGGQQFEQRLVIIKE